MTSQMSGFSRGRVRKFKAEINVVPYIDVMLVLLVIFMVAAPMTTPEVINLPTAGKSALPPVEYIHVTLQADQSASIRVSGKKSASQAAEKVASHTDLLNRLRKFHQENPDFSVMIAADKDIKYDDVIKVISEAKKLGIDRVGLAIKPVAK